jgi:sugar fermentation stimulation protein A
MIRKADTELDEAVSLDEEMQLFVNDQEAFLVQRHKRFLVIANDGNTELVCHCPNPGRLIEFIFPGALLILEKRRCDAQKKYKNQEAVPVSHAKTTWTVGGIYHHDGIVPLFAARANQAAEKLILRKLIPGLRKIQREYSIGDSRFDFLGIDADGQRHLIEVKACSLVEHGRAMFPDAPSTRALKHLEELATLIPKGYCCHVLFVIVHGNPVCFIPNLHTDPAFAAGLSKYGVAVGADPCIAGDKVQIHAALLHCNKDGKAVLAALHVPVDLGHGGLAERDSGNYLMLLEIPEQKNIVVGSLGSFTFAAGWYVYTGSAQKNLSHRIKRHLRKIRKKTHWHLDYLTPHTRSIQALPIMSYRNLECDLAQSLHTLGGVPIPGFGCSDCNCESHLFYFAKPPMENWNFVETLLRYRHVEGLKK